MLYQYECSDCQKVAEEFRSVAERNNAPLCCGKPMQKVLGGHRVVGDLEPYYDENLETYVRSKLHRKQVMRERDVYEKYGKGWR